jgi:nucleotide-binding universal stress UspA family protein
MKFLVCYDDSNVAVDALKTAVQRAKAFNAKVYVVTSIKGGADVPRKLFVRVEKDLKQVKAQIEEQGIECETRLSVRGLEPGEDLVQFAKQQNIEEIFVGVKRRSKVGKLVFGSTAQYVILEAPCPVCTVK